MKVSDYKKRYKGKTQDELHQIIGSIEGGDTPNYDCLEAVRSLLDDITYVEPVNHTEVHPDYLVAKQYINKATNCRKRGIDFQLSWHEYKAIKNKNSCFYTGIKFDESDLNRLTIDRIDSSIGYTRDNSVACANQINALKESLFECEGRKTTITAKQLKRMAERLIERGQ